MRLEPKDLFEKLEFDKIIELLVKECLGEQGIERIRALQPQTNLIQIEERLKEVTELKRSIEHNDRLPLLAYENIDSDLQLLAIVDAVLPEDGLRRINTILVSIGNIYKFFTPSRREFYKTLYEVVRPVHFDPALAKEIDRVIDPDGNIRPDASPELLRIHKLTQSKMKELDRVFRDIINDYRAKGWLSDSVESFRNGRRVLSVPAEHKRKIRGIIHDESATGKTAFIEPEAVIEINNDIFDLEQQERREIYRILKELSTILRPYVPQLHQYQEIMVYFDVVQAKARLAVRMKAIAPLMLDTSSLEIYEGYHPLLLLKNSGSGKKTVPFDLRLDGGNRILVLSGPNAGGKSITMKSTGLLQLMAQSGLLIPVNKRRNWEFFTTSLPISATSNPSKTT